MTNEESQPHTYYVVKNTYTYDNKLQHSYKMFDQVKNATDHILELTMVGKKGTLFEAKEIPITLMVVPQFKDKKEEEYEDEYEIHVDGFKEIRKEK